MGIGSALVQGGLLARDVQQYDDQQAERGLRMRTIQSGIQRMDDEDAARPGRLELERLRQDIARTEAEYKKRTMPADQAMADTERGMRNSDLTHRAAMQPGAQEGERLQQGAALTVARGAAGMAPGQVQLAQAQQQEQMRTVREQQTARLWGLYRNGDTEGFLTALNESSMISPGRKFSEVKQVNAPGPSGEVPALQFVAADGKPSITVPLAEMEANYRKHGSKIISGNGYVLQVDPSGQKVTPLYEKDAIKVVAEGGYVVDSKGKRITDGAASAAGGIAPQSRKQQDHVDGRVKMAIDKVIMPRFGGKFEGGVFFPDAENKDVATRAVLLAGKFIREDGMDPEAAGGRAIEQAEYEKALGQLGGKGPADKPAADTGYKGPAPWKAPQPTAPTVPQVQGAPRIDPAAAAAATPVSLPTAPQRAGASAARSGTASRAAKIVADQGLPALISTVEEMFPPQKKMVTMRGGAQQEVPVDSPEVAKLKSLTGREAMIYADQLLSERVTAGAQ